MHTGAEIADLLTGKATLPAMAGLQAERCGWLIVTSSANLEAIGRVASLRGGECLVGRGAASDLRIGDRGLSRRHARLERRTSGDYFVVDLDSRNGTWLNGVRVREAVITDGDRLQLGTTGIQFSTRSWLEPEEEALCRQALVTDSLLRAQVTDRLEALGLLSAGLAHEINNPLASVSANLDWICGELPSITAGPDARRLGELQSAAKEARQALERIRVIVDDLRTFSQGGGTDGAALQDVNEILDYVLRLSAEKLERRARVVRALEEVPRIRASRARLVQLFLNLIVNACRALPPDHPHENEIRIGTRTDRRARGLVVSISDTGSGIAPEICSKIFDPFFTTKGVGDGAGLGLSVCASIVRALGGDLRVETEVGKGSTFEIRLPADVSDRSTPPRKAITLA